MALFDPVWATDGQTDVPSEAEIRLGFTCGPVSPARFNYIIQALEGAINSLDIDAAVPSTRRIDTAPGLTGGGDLSQNRTLSIDLLTLQTRTAIANGDWVLVYDVSENEHVKMTRANFIAGLGGGGGTVAGGANIGGAAGEIFSALDGTNLEFRTIAVGDGLTVVTAGDVVTIAFGNLPSELTDE